MIRWKFIVLSVTHRACGMPPVVIVETQRDYESKADQPAGRMSMDVRDPDVLAFLTPGRVFDVEVVGRNGEQ